MGEYAYYNNDLVKIGTCEDMYYLRADQRHLVRDYEFTPDLRYRFPFPDEDDQEPGEFRDFERGVAIPGYKPPAAWTGDHTVERVDLIQQKVVHGELWAIVRVMFEDQPGSLDGELFRLPTGEALEASLCFINEAQRLNDNPEPTAVTNEIASFYAEIAKRLLAGYSIKREHVG